MQRRHRNRSRPTPAQQSRRTIRQGSFDTAMIQAAIDSIQYRPKSPREKAASERSQSKLRASNGDLFLYRERSWQRLCYTLPRFAITRYFLRSSSRISVRRSTSVGPTAGGGMILFA